MASGRNQAEDVVRDERANRQNGPILDEGAIRAHHVDTLWLGTGVHMPVHSNGPHRRHRRRHRRSRDPTSKHEAAEPEDKKRILPPGQRVQFLLSHEDELGAGGNDSQLEAHRIFSEMVELHGTDANQEWRETARWVKFEEDVEEGGNRWSKPHVATLSLHSLFELRSCIMNGGVVLDMEATDFSQIIDIMLDKMIAAKHIEEDQRDAIRDALMRKQTHQYENARSGGKEKDAGLHPGQSFLQTVRSIADIGRSFSHAKNLQQQEAAGGSVASPGGLPPVASGVSLGTTGSNHPQLSKQESVPGPNQLQLPKVGSLPKDMVRESSTVDASKGNQHFFKKLPPGAEASNVLIGMVEFLEHHVSAFIRLKNAQMLGNLTEVPVPTRFLFILLGPADHGPQYREIGRAIATLMSDEVFHEVAYKAQSRNDLLDGVDEFLDQVTVLPPGEWDPNIRIEPPTSIPSQDKRKAPEPPKAGNEEAGAVAVVEEEEGHGMDPALKRTGRLFGGLIADIKRKAPFYPSDIKDVLNLQCLAATMFMYFAMLAPIVTFGGLLDEATEKRMGAMENLLSGAICGSVYHLTAGQPLTMIGSTGPVLVFEKIIYDICKQTGLKYLTFRLWINVWSAIILILMVATDASALVSYITRFTEESFAALISFIFIYESIAKLLAINSKSRTVEWNPRKPVSAYTTYDCTCGVPYNESDTKAVDKTINEIMHKVHKYHWNTTGWLNNETYGPYGNESRYVVDWNMIPTDYCGPAHGKLIGDCYPMRDVFLLSVVLAIGTFAIAMTLKLSRNSSYFPSKVREVLSDFAVIIAITVMVIVDHLFGLDTMKLAVPPTVTPTWSGRGWLIDPFDNPWWTIPLTLVPSLLMCILLFMDQQITVVIVNRKENKLKKGCGYHLDLLILALLVIVTGFLGLPIFVAATVMSISHVNALKVESECRAPGEKPTFIGVREQRMTGFLVFVLIGVSVAMTEYLRMIPMPVLYGVFLYMGISSLRGVQMVDRLLLLFMPLKYQPDLIYLRHVPIKRVHLFTAFQITCFTVLCVIKEIKITSIVFPLMLVFMVGIRKLMEYVFTERELKYLDDKMPDITLRKKEDAKKKKEQLQQEQRAQDDTDRQPKFQTVCTEANLHIPLASGNVMKIPLSSIVDEPSSSGTAPAGQKHHQPPLNLSEELNKTGMWKHIESETSFVKDENRQPSFHQYQKPKSGSGFPKKGSGANLALAAPLKSPEVVDTEDDFEPITIKIDRATPLADRAGDTAASRNETQPLLGDQKKASDSKDEKQESSV